MSRLSQSPRLFTLVRDLGLKPSDNLVRDILGFCDRRIADLAADFSDRRNPSAVLEWIASKLGTRFELVWNDADLINLQEKYMALGEVGFVDLFNELSDNVFGITVSRHEQQPYEPPFVSVIDCRGDKGARRYFTKWHEVAHLITMTDQLRLVFRRTQCSTQSKDPEEALMDIIAGEFGFRPPAEFQFESEEISFEAIDNLRQQLCPEASKQAALISLLKFWPTPCILITGRMAMRRRDEAQGVQNTFDFVEPPAQHLRAVYVTQSNLARETGFSIFRNMRIPNSSIIHRVYSDGLDYLEALENLDMWESREGGALPSLPVMVKARRSWDAVEALLMPASVKTTNATGTPTKLPPTSVRQRT